MFFKNSTHTYTKYMDDSIDLPNIPGYVSIKEAASILGLSSRTVYEYVDEGRLPAKRAADVIMILLDDVRSFKRGTSGRPRKSVPPWRISSGDNTQFSTLILVSIRPGQDTAFLQKLEDVKQNKHHSFPGTVVRYVIGSETFPGQVQILLVWRNTVMPNSQTRTQALALFQQELDDVLDWSTAEYNNGTVFMHT
jgi:Helix-turn-helix domain